MQYKEFRVTEGKTLNLKKHKTDATGKYKTKEEAVADLEKNIERLAKLQDVLYAQNHHALLIIIQALDAAGKDGLIKHVMTGLNPQGCQVFSFKAPSPEELDHDFLWRASKSLPERGRLGIFNRSYYEEVLVVRVHPNFLQNQPLPTKTKSDKKVWEKRFEDIRNFEKYLTRNGIHVLKIFLNVSKDEQKKRFLGTHRTTRKELEIFRRRFKRTRPLGRLSKSLSRSNGSHFDRKIAVVCHSGGQ